MRRIGPVKLGTDVVYAYFIIDGRAAKLRLSPDECHRHDLFPGQQARTGLNGGEAAVTLVTAVGPAPPFVWVAVAFAVPRERSDAPPG